MKSNKQVALIVKEDGLIYVNEVPEEPHLFSSDYLELRNAQQDYEKALASAKESAIRVKHQFLGFHLIAKHFPDLDTIEPPEPGIYPIEGLTLEDLL